MALDYQKAPYFWLGSHPDLSKDRSDHFPVYTMFKSYICLFLCWWKVPILYTFQLLKRIFWNITGSISSFIFSLATETISFFTTQMFLLFNSNAQNIILCKEYDKNGIAHIYFFFCSGLDYSNKTDVLISDVSYLSSKLRLVKEV